MSFNRSLKIAFVALLVLLCGAILIPAIAAAAPGGLTPPPLPPALPPLPTPTPPADPAPAPATVEDIQSAAPAPGVATVSMDMFYQRPTPTPVPSATPAPVEIRASTEATIAPPGELQQPEVTTVTEPVDEETEPATDDAPSQNTQPALFQWLSQLVTFIRGR